MKTPLIAVPETLKSSALNAALICSVAAPLFLSSTLSKSQYWLTLTGIHPLPMYGLKVRLAGQVLMTAFQPFAASLR
ncbi:MAG: hypothetical protein R3E64_18560 [Halioglobus sp.]